MNPDVRRRLDEFFIQRQRLALLKAVADLIDLSMLEYFLERLSGPQAAIDGFPPMAINKSANWLELARLARPIQECGGRVDSEVLAAIDRTLGATIPSWRESQEDIPEL